MLHHLFRRVRHTPGTPDYALGPQYDGSGASRFIFADYMLPGVRFYGTGTIPNSSLRVHQHPQVYVVKAVQIAGLGGIQAGQIILSPLIQNPNG